MFPSAGYFRSANCPFFIHGLCHRPYCHFRHAKPGHGSTSKSTVKNCLKSKVPATSTGTTQDVAPRSPSPPGIIASHKKPSELVTEKDQPKNPDTKNESKATATKIESCDEEPQKASQTKSESLLESLNKLEQAVEEASASLLSSTCGSKKISSLVTSKCKTMKTLNIEFKTTADENNLVSLCKGNNLNTNIQENVEVFSKNEPSSVIPSVDKTGKEQKSSQEILSKKTQSLTENSHSSLEVMSFGVDELKNDKESEGLFKELGQDIVERNIGSVSGKKKFDTIVEELVLPAKKRKSSHSSDDVQKKVMDKTAEKSSAGSHVLVGEEKVSLKSKKVILKNIDARKLSDELKLKKARESSERTKIASTSSKQEIKNKDKALKLEKADKKVKRQLVDINFFTSPKKSKSKAQQKESETITETVSGKLDDNNKVELKTFHQHNKVRTSNFDECINKDRIATETLKTGERSKNETNTNISIDSLFESDEDKEISSDNISDSDHDTMDSGNETLKEIFDNYDPQQEKTKGLSVDNVAGTSGVESVEVSPPKERNPSLVELPGLGKKKRVAHNASYLVKGKTSNVNPIRRLPKDAPSIPARQPQPTTLERNAIQAKKRVAHVPKPTTETSLARPRIPIEYGAKVPQNLRQRYLDKIIDENLRLYATEKEAFEKGIEEERSIYNRATRRPMYLNLCCNAIKVLRSKPTPDFQSEPSPPTNIACPTATTSLTKDARNIDSKPIDASKLTEELTYKLLSQYIMTEEQLVDNGYPRPSPSSPGKVTFKPRRPPPTPSKDPNRRTCCRCGKNYSVREDGTYVRQEDCVYHVGRLFKRRTAGEISSSYQCCGGDASTPGCAVCKYHVSEGKNATEGFMTTIINPLAGNRKKVFGLDCEMCYTLAGLELTRVTVVNWKLEKIYDTFVKPDSPILDYNTRFSGVTQECLRGVKTSIREVQAVLLSMISKDSILVGHSLESDLLSLKLVHDTVVDTSVVFPHRLGPPYKRALRTLMAEFVKKIIQNNEEGHDSYEDAKASLELMLFKIKEDLKKKPKNKR